jgi:type I restriction enzyme S subunit
VYKRQVYISEDIDKSMSNSRIRPNDILLNITGASIGRCFYAPANFKKGNVNQHVCIIRPIQKKITTNFLHFEIISQYGQILIDISQNGANREGLNFQQIKNFVFPNPSINEQTTIASYLDTKTTAIDRKIELLTAKAEKYKALRRSLINETVCRGLNPDAPIKDSGIEWIGMIPEHWEVKRVKDIFYIGRGRVIGQEELVDEGIYPVYSSQTENNGCLGYIDTFDFNATLLTWTTDGANAGTLFKREGKFNCTNVCGTLKPKKRKENLDFILYALQIAAKHNKRIDTNGAKIMNNEMSVIPLLYPPEKEQESIAQYLNVKTTQIDTILTNISEQINKLAQLRKTLINDVVTGKIKVTED